MINGVSAPSGVGFGNYFAPAVGAGYVYGNGGRGLGEASSQGDFEGMNGLAGVVGYGQLNAAQFAGAFNTQGLLSFGAAKQSAAYQAALDEYAANPDQAWANLKADMAQFRGSLEHTGAKISALGVKFGQLMHDCQSMI